MAKRRVIAHFMHEDEEIQALRLMEDSISTQSFVLGWLEESQFDLLREQGLIVSIVDEERDDPLSEFLDAEKSISSTQLGVGRPRDGEAKPGYYVTQLPGPMIEGWRSELEGAGASVLEALGANKFCIKVDDDRYSRVSRLEFIQRLEPLTSGSRALEFGAASAEEESRRDFVELKIHDIRLENEGSVRQVSRWLSEHDLRIVGSSRRKIRFYIDPLDPALQELAALPGVDRVEEFIAPELCNNRARVLVGLESNNAHRTIDLEGEGQIIGVADSGLDYEHPDFENRIHGLIALARKDDASDLHGHGTHVAGTALGSGAASVGRYKGAAPGARVFFQSIMDRRNRLSGLPIDLVRLFQEAYDAGARVHNNSWTVDAQARYTFHSIEVDEFVQTHPDMTIVVAAGNDGRSDAPKNSDQGFVDWMSVGAPATAKNAITVGASRSDRKRGGRAELTFGEIWPNSFPDPPIRDERTSGDPESLAAFSSRGPCADRRIKPDLVAPGTNIISARSSLAPLGNFWGAHSPHDGRYAYMGGTSMATPLVSGCAALVRQYYEQKANHNASSALVKATLINGTRWLTGSDATARAFGRPNFHQGFGCLNMPTTLPNRKSPNLSLEFLDAWETGELDFTVTGQRYRFEFETDGQGELRFCLAWNDVPANALQNNLNLFVQRQPRGEKYMGNEKLPYALRLPDEENNVEIVRIPEPQAGTYLVQISSGNLLYPNQPFALVVTGSGLSKLRRR